MTQSGLWQDALFREMIGVVFLFLLALSGGLFYLRKKSDRYMAAWASARSWLIASPFLFVFFAFGAPFPLFFLCIVSIFSAKTFYRMVGMYHRTWFVWLTYIFILALGHVIYHQYDFLYNLLPMIFLLTVCLIPLLRNSATHMVQYIALSLMCFIFFGWCLMHFGRMLMFDKGIYLVMYVFILSEFGASLGAGVRLFAKINLFPNITKRLTLEGLALSIGLSIFLAWGLRHMLVDRSPKYWITYGIIAAIAGRLGDLVLSVIRRDLKIKDSGVFIIGRDDILARVNSLVFVGPMIYYAYLFLERI